MSKKVSQAFENPSPIEAESSLIEKIRQRRRPLIGLASVALTAAVSTLSPANASNKPEFELYATSTKYEVFTLKSPMTLQNPGRPEITYKGCNGHVGFRLQRIGGYHPLNYAAWSPLGLKYDKNPNKVTQPYPLFPVEPPAEGEYPSQISFPPGKYLATLYTSDYRNNRPTPCSIKFAHISGLKTPQRVVATHRLHAEYAPGEYNPQGNGEYSRVMRSEGPGVNVKSQYYFLISHSLSHGYGVNHQAPATDPTPPQESEACFNKSVLPFYPDPLVGVCLPEAKPYHEQTYDNTSGDTSITGDYYRSLDDIVVLDPATGSKEGSVQEKTRTAGNLQLVIGSLIVERAQPY